MTAVNDSSGQVWTVWQQTAGLGNKHAKLRLRAWKTNLMQILQAILFMFLIWAIDKAIVYSRQQTPAFAQVQHPASAAVRNIPACRQNTYLQQGVPCYTFLYTPNNDVIVHAIVSAMMASNDPVIPQADVQGFATVSEVDAFMLAHPQTTLGAVHFKATDSQHISYTLQSNTSANWFKGHYQNPNTYFQLPLQLAAERATARYLANDSTLGWNVSYTSFAHPASASASVVGSIAPTFLFASAMFNFVLLLQNLVSEKESGVRQMMGTMGLQSTSFWLVWALLEGLQALVSTLLTLAAAYAFQFEFVWDNSFGLIFFLLLLTNLALVALAFLTSTFIQRASSAVPLGFGLFVVGWVCLLVVAFGFPYSTHYSLGFVALFSLVPWTLLSKGIQDLAEASAGDGAAGISWSQRYSYCQATTPSLSQQQSLGYYTTNCVLPLPHLFLVAAAQCVVYMLMAVYLDKVLPDRMGVRALPPWFLLLPSYWRPNKGCRKGDTTQHAAAALQQSNRRQGSPSIDADVAAEAALMQARCTAWISSQQAPPRGETHKTSSSAVLPEATTEALINPDRTAVTVSKSSRTTHADEADSTCNSSSSTAVVETINLAAVNSVPAAATANAESTAVITESTAAHAALVTHAVRPTDVLMTPPDAASFDNNRGYAIEMFGLRRAFWKRPALWKRVFKCEKASAAVAVNSNWLGIQQGQNGAGKSTTINCLTGLLPTTAGEALVHGSSVLSPSGLAKARVLLGVCPQFDVLWDNLNGKEHLLLFGAIKGLSRQQAEQQAVALLDKVKLTEAGGTRAGAYSGGMRRRLSLAIALLGSPKVLYLDEPTTGMDPVSRRHVWNLIASLKENCAIVLTTHSMEEADVLGDRIGIMAKGQLQCLGSPIHLKQKFGSGYLLSIRLLQVETDAHITPHEELTRIVHQHVKADVVHQDNSLVQYQIALEAASGLSSLFAAVKENQAGLRIADIQIRLTPLEEVFMAVVHMTDTQHAQTTLTRM